MGKDENLFIEKTINYVDRYKAFTILEWSQGRICPIFHKIGFDITKNISPRKGVQKGLLVYGSSCPRKELPMQAIQSAVVLALGGIHKLRK